MTKTLSNLRNISLPWMNSLCIPDYTVLSVLLIWYRPTVHSRIVYYLYTRTGLAFGASISGCGPEAQNCNSGSVHLAIPICLCVVCIHYLLIFMSILSAAIAWFLQCKCWAVRLWFICHWLADELCSIVSLLSVSGCPWVSAGVCG